MPPSRTSSIIRTSWSVAAARWCAAARDGGLAAFRSAPLTLSLGKLAQRRPDILITDQPQIEPPDYQVFLTISTLDVTAGGTATMEADWLVVPRNTAQPSQRKRGAFTATGSTATDQGVVSLNTALLQQLADAIGASSPW